MAIRILSGLCRLCDACIAVCPPQALYVEAQALRWEASRCEDCRHCLQLCPAGALWHEPAPRQVEHERS